MLLWMHSTFPVLVPLDSSPAFPTAQNHTRVHLQLLCTSVHMLYNARPHFHLFGPYQSADGLHKRSSLSKEVNFDLLVVNQTMLLWKLSLY